MNILYTVNDAFVPQLAAGMVSVCENNEVASEINFYVFSDGVTEDNRRAIAQMLVPYGRKVSFVDICGFMEKVGQEFDTSGWNEIVMSRLLVASFMPETVSRVIYLDGDTIVRRSLESFWSLDLKGKTIGVAPEPTADKKRRRNLGIADRHYFNAGVLLIDLDKWRERSVEQRVLDYCRTNADGLFANDQDALNVVLKDEAFYVPPALNSCNSYWLYPFSWLNELMPGFCTESEYFEARNNPTIVHYLGEERPWRKGNQHRYGSSYVHYLGKTPWRDAPMEDGWVAYFKAWKAFNSLFAHFPKARYRIVNGLIPMFMKFRKLHRKKR